MSEIEYDPLIIGDKIQYIIYELEQKIRVCYNVIELQDFPDDEGRSYKLLRGFMLTLAKQVNEPFVIEHFRIKNIHEIKQTCLLGLENLKSENLIIVDYLLIRKSLEEIAKDECLVLSEHFEKKHMALFKRFQNYAKLYAIEIEDIEYIRKLMSKT